MEKNKYKSIKLGLYASFFKRIFDFFIALFSLIIFSPLFLIVAILVRVRLGSPVLFKQVRPGKVDNKTGKEKLFYVYKFRTMTDKRDENGDLLSDEERLTKFGTWLRSTSLDEIPQLFNILKGDMALVGPRPHLVKDAFFMDEKERMRAEVRPGLTGLAQVKGRNGINWDEKMKYDNEYINHLTFVEDLKIIFLTFSVLFSRRGISSEGLVTHEDLGVFKLKKGLISQSYYDETVEHAKEVVKEFQKIG